MDPNTPHLEFHNGPKKEKYYRVVKRVLYSSRGEQDQYCVQYWSWLGWQDTGFNRLTAQEAVGWIKTQCFKPLPFVEEVVWKSGYYLPVNGGNGNY